MKPKRQIRKNRPINAARGQWPRARANRRTRADKNAEFIAPEGLRDLARQEEETELRRFSLIREHVGLIERHGSPEVRLHLFKTIKYVASVVRSRLAAANITEPGLYCIAEVIRHSRTLPTSEAKILLAGFTDLLPKDHQAANAITRALKSKNRDDLLDLVQLGQFDFS